VKTRHFYPANSTISSLNRVFGGEAYHLRNPIGSRWDALSSPLSLRNAPRPRHKHPQTPQITMPRPIVPAHQRQRAAEACNLCRETKKRCSGSAPCTQCVRRGLESQCFITYAPRGSRTRARAEAAKAAAAGSVTTEQMSASSHQSSQPMETDEGYRPLSPSHSQQDDEKDSQTEASNPPRMLLNSRGERGMHACHNFR
jgi:hypothetical protein